MRPFEASEYLYFYALTNAGALLPVRALPNADSGSPPANAPWIAKSVPPFEAMWSLDQPPHQQDMNTRFSPYPLTVDFNPYRELIARLAPFPGRKNLVCINCLFEKPAHFDSGLDAAWNARAADMRQMAEAFRQARIAVYAAGGKPTFNKADVVDVPLPADQIGANKIVSLVHIQLESFHNELHAKIFLLYNLYMFEIQMLNKKVLIEIVLFHIDHLFDIDFRYYLYINQMH